MYFLKTLQVRAPCHGGVLYSFWYWWNVVWIFYEFFKYWNKFFMFSSRFMLFPTLKKKICVKKILSHKYWKVPLHLLVKWEVVSPNSREGQLESMSIISSIPLFWFCISNVAVVWGGEGVVMFFSHFMLFPTCLEKKIWEYKTIISQLIFLRVFFLLSGPLRNPAGRYEFLSCW